MINTYETQDVDAQGVHNKLSGAIRQGADEMEKLIEEPAYKIDMAQWHRPHKGICHVCLSGAIMAGICKSDHRSDLFCDAFPWPTGDKLISIDSARLGNITTAIKYWPVDEYNEIPRGEAWENFITSIVWKFHGHSMQGAGYTTVENMAADLRELADGLERFGL